MKKNLCYVLLAAMMIIGSNFTVRVVRERNKSSMLEKNFEALVDGEYRVGIGVVCAYLATADGGASGRSCAGGRGGQASRHHATKLLQERFERRKSIGRNILACLFLIP